MVKTVENQPFDYRLGDRVWQRVAPGETPYPEVRAAGAGERGPAVPLAPPGDLCRELLRQELRHAAELLQILEKGLANSQ